MWQFQIKFLDKYIKNLILKKGARIPAIYIGTFWESIPRNFLDKIPNVLEKIEKSWKKNKTIHTVFKISTDLFQVRHGSLSLQTNTRKINKQENVNKQCQTSFLTRKKNKKNPRKFQENFKKFQKIPANAWKKILETSWKKILRKTYLIRSLVQAADELCSRFFWVFWNPQKWFQVFSYLLHQFWH